MVLLEVSNQTGNPALNIFRERLKQFKAEEVSWTFLTIQTHETYGLTPFSDEQRNNERGQLNFSDDEMRAAANILADELTGTRNTIEKLDNLAQKKFGKKMKKKRLGLYLFHLEIDTLQEGIKIGIEIAVDERGEWVRDYKVVHVRA